MSQLFGVFDVVLVSTLLGLAWAALRCTGHFRAVVLFISFGLVMALCWLRLQAPDVALAEAAIGAGLTGALLLSTAAALDARPRRDHSGVSRPPEGEEPS